MKSVKIYDGAYRIYDPLGVYLFLLVGSERALLIDTGYGAWDLKETVERLTDKEVMVCNTHGHLDHNGGNGLFPSVFQSEADAETDRFHSDPERRYEFVRKFFRCKAGKAGELLLRLPALKRLQKKICEPLPATLVPMPSSFDLGDRRIEVIPTPGHTPGCCCFLDRRYGILFTGDTVCDEGVLLHCDHSLSVSVFRQSIARLQALRAAGAFDTMIPSHHKEILTPEYLAYYDKLCEMILSGEIQGKPVADEAGTGRKAVVRPISLSYKELS